VKATDSRHCGDGQGRLGLGRQQGAGRRRLTCQARRQR
jgi:hypothetical protein